MNKKPTKDFLHIARKTLKLRNPQERIHDFLEFSNELSPEERKKQGSRCMDCGVPFCQSSYGCPVDNLIPEWNQMIHDGQWEKAFLLLRKTNNFPEYTGRVCPAPCESACVLGLGTELPVTIKDNEYAIADYAYRSGLMNPRIPKNRTDKRIAIIGSGPAGLAAADQLNQAGNTVDVFERNDRVGGLLMYGIPNMKLDKKLIEKRNQIMEKEGISFFCNVNVGVDKDPREIIENYDAILLACGASQARHLPIAGANLKNVHLAMDFLHANTKSFLDSNFRDKKYISAKDKNVIVIGGGDTGTDCIATAIRHGAKSVINFEILERPADDRTEEYPWPSYPRIFKRDYGHEEILTKFQYDPRKFAILSKQFLANDKNEVRAVETVQVGYSPTKDQQKRPRIQEIPNSEKVFPADLVLLALGFTGVDSNLIERFKIKTDESSNILAKYGDFRTSRDKIFAAGDARRGQSLVVWAIKEGRYVARQIDMAINGGVTSLHH